MGQIPLSVITKYEFGRKYARQVSVLVTNVVVKPDSAEVPLRTLNIRDETITI